MMMLALWLFPVKSLISVQFCENDRSRSYAISLKLYLKSLKEVYYDITDSSTLYILSTKIYIN